MFEILNQVGINHKGDIESARKEFIRLVPKVIDSLSALVGAATESTNDIVTVLRVLSYFKKNFKLETELQHATSRALTLAFNSK